MFKFESILIFKIMETKKLTLILSFLIASVSVFSQDYAFKVLASKGGNEVKSGDSWQPVKTGATIKATDELKISDNSYVGLVHRTGKPIELKTAGSWPVSELEKKVGTGA